MQWTRQLAFLERAPCWMCNWSWRHVYGNRGELDAKGSRESGLVIEADITFRQNTTHTANNARNMKEHRDSHHVHSLYDRHGNTDMYSCKKKVSHTRRFVFDQEGVCGMCLITFMLAMKTWTDTRRMSVIKCLRFTDNFYSLVVSSILDNNAILEATM